MCLATMHGAIGVMLIALVPFDIMVGTMVDALGDMVLTIV